MKFIITKFDNHDKKFLYGAEPYFFYLRLGSFVIKLYYDDWYFDMQIGTHNKGITTIIATQNGYKRMRE